MKIIDLENKILELRRELNECISNSNLDEIKIKAIQQDINLLQYQLNIIKKENIDIEKETISRQAPKDTKPVKDKKQRKSIEKIIGQIFMGIFASICIFTSLIVFFSMSIKYMPIMAQIGVVYIISFGIAAMGVKFVREDNNKYSLSICGCGIGAVYITLFLSNLYFKLFGDIFLYVCLFFWSIFVCCFAKLQSKILMSIGQIGITIACIFGFVKCFMIKDEMNLLLMVIFFAITEIIYTIIFIKNTWKIDINAIGSTLVGIIFAIGVINCYGFREIIITEIIMIATMIFIFIIQAIGNTNIIIKNITMLMNVVVIWLLIEYPIFMGVLALILFIVHIILETNKIKKIDFLSMFLIALFVLSFSQYEIISCSAAVISIIPAIYIAYSYNRKDLIMFTYGVLCFSQIATFPDMTGYLSIGLQDVMVLSVITLMRMIYIKYSTEGNIGAYLFSLIAVFQFVNGFTNYFLEKYSPYSMGMSGIVIGFIVVFICNLLFRERVKKLHNKSYSATAMIINAMIMSISIININALSDRPILHILIIILAIASFVLNSKRFLNKTNGNLWVCIKYFVLMLTILNSFNAANFVISISCLIFSCLSIVFGFKGKYKTMRIFGLALSCLSIAKLMLIDIHAESTIMKAFSYLICGIMCFAINMIYNKIDKKQNEK